MDICLQFWGDNLAIVKGYEFVLGGSSPMQEDGNWGKGW
jgi:hypothetical protein